MSVIEFPGGKQEEEQKSASEVLREFADVLEGMEAEFGFVEVAGVALVPEIGVALAGNSGTGNDGMMTMLEIGKTAIVMQYLNGDEYEAPVFH